MFHQPTARRIVKEVSKRVRPAGPTTPLRCEEERDQTESSPPFMNAWPEVTRADIIRCAEKEHAHYLVGIFYRRAGLGCYFRIPHPKVREAAELVAPVLGWDTGDVDREVETNRAYVRKYRKIGNTPYMAGPFQAAASFLRSNTSCRYAVGTRPAISPSRLFLPVLAILQGSLLYPAIGQDHGGIYGDKLR